MRLVVDAEYYVSVGHDGEDQRLVALADKADPGVAAVGGRGGVVEPGWVVGVLAGAYGFCCRNQECRFFDLDVEILT